MKNKRDLNRILGGLIGLACGDALGCTLEFSTPHSPHKTLKDITGGGPFGWKCGEITDDTQMTLCVARGILKEPSNPINEIGNQFVKWYDSNPKDIGTTCSLSIQNFKELGDWTKACSATNEKLNNKTAGNGSLMRCLPIALTYTDYDIMLKFTVGQSLLTHLSYIASYCCCEYNSIIFKILDGLSKNQIKNELKISQFNLANCWELPKFKLKPTGYAVDSIVCALWCFLNTNSFEEALIEAVNLGGDSDTIGAICGGICGAFYGYNNIPNRWKNKILIKDTLFNVSTHLQAL